ncbi:unnamed protein product [Peniophora sp. CBMAI 1063]|nr:unnamed protein product [Peniophora sp. CBMAI 1063]
MPLESRAILNATRPVARVMSIPELFAVIMHFALDVYMPSILPHILCKRFDKPEPVVGTRRLGAAVVVSHVCSAWRAICIGTPTLWARLIGQVPSAINEFVARSGQSQVDIHSATVPSIHSGRIRSLIWSTDTEAFRDDESKGFMQSILRKPLHNLVSLDLDMVWWCRSPTFDDVDVLDVPQLTRLKLWHTRTLLLHTLFRAPRLKELSILDVVLSITWILNLLDISRLLDTLMVMNCGYVAQELDDSPRTQKLELPNLQTLGLFDDNDISAARVFCQLLILLCHRPTIFQAFLEIGWTESLLLVCLRHLLIRDAPNCLYVEDGMEIHADMDVSTPRGLGNLGHSESYNRSYVTCYDRIWFLEAIPSLGIKQELSNITALVIHTDGVDLFNKDEATLRLMMHALPHVETYWFVGPTPTPNRTRDSSRVYTCMWRSLYPAEGADDEDQLPLPRLRVLGVNFPMDDSEQLLDDIVDILAIREGAGSEVLELLSLPWIPRPSEDVVDEVSSFAKQIHWAFVDSEAGDADNKE